MKSIKDKVLAEYEKGNIVVAGIEGLQTMPIKEFIKQPEDGMLYDLNRLESVVLTFIDDPKWINDFAVAKTIRVLKARIAALESQEEKECYNCHDKVKMVSKGEFCPNCACDQ